MGELMQRAEASCSRVELFVLKINGRARALYSRLGFAEQEELQSHVRMSWPQPVKILTR